MNSTMTNSSPSNIKGSRFKKFGYHDKESGMTYEPETVVGKTLDKPIKKEKPVMQHAKS